MVRFLHCLILFVFVVGCSKENKPTTFEKKHDEHAHGHEHNKMMVEDFGPYHERTGHGIQDRGNTARLKAMCENAGCTTS